jgi:2OG-Fe(II) oxygenase superfamily
VGDLDLEIRGVGRLHLPVPEDQAALLAGIGRPARYGKGEQTLLDSTVRDTGEIPRSQVTIDQRRWNRTLLAVVDQLGQDLGLPEGAGLRPELHSMLVYGPGQFFVPHQDSEKADDMVASLVVTLPSAFTGGSLVVEHHGKRATYRSTKTSLSFVAFYSDCRHEIRPVTSGHRIVLTYNLHLGTRRPLRPPLAHRRPRSRPSPAAWRSTSRPRPASPAGDASDQPANPRTGSSTCSTTSTPSAA